MAVRRRADRLTIYLFFLYPGFSLRAAESFCRRVVYHALFFIVKNITCPYNMCECVCVCVCMCVCVSSEIALNPNGSLFNWECRRVLVCLKSVQLR